MIAASSMPRFKDTAANISATKQFTVGIISEPFVEHANITSMDAPEGVSEWEASGLTKASSVSSRPTAKLQLTVLMDCVNLALC